MHYFLIIVVLVVTGFFFAGCGKKTRGRTTIDVNISNGQTFSKQDIEEHLEKIKKAPLPEFSMKGAMCYEVADPPDRIDYVCPDCGEKTLYAIGSTADPNEQFLWNITKTLNELENYQHHVKQIDTIDISLVQSQFCKHCNPDIKEPKLGLIVKYPDSQQVHRVYDISIEDLMMIKAFTEGKLTYIGELDNEYILISDFNRLEELLGVDIDDP